MFRTKSIFRKYFRKRNNKIYFQLYNSDEESSGNEEKGESKNDHEHPFQRILQQKIRKPRTIWKQNSGHTWTMFVIRK